MLKIEKITLLVPQFVPKGGAFMVAPSVKVTLLPHKWPRVSIIIFCCSLNIDFLLIGVKRPI